MYRRRRFGRPGAAAPIKEETRVATRRQRCRACQGTIAVGESSVRFMLRRQFRRPCGSCGNEPRRVKWFHTACRPADVNKAMGFNPNAANTYAPLPTSKQASVAPPPKPPSAEELGLQAIVTLEAALVARVREKKLPMTTDLTNAFKTFQNIKARVLRPGTPAEGEVAMNIALQHIVKLAFQ